MEWERSGRTIELRRGITLLEDRSAIHIYLSLSLKSFPIFWPSGIQGANLVHHNIFPTIRQSRSELSVTL